MKSIVVALLLFFLLGFAWFFFTADNNRLPERKTKQGFVSLKDGHFVLNNQQFFPLAVNYIAMLRINGNHMFPGVYGGYEPDSKYKFNTEDSCIRELQAHFNFIHDLGFNSIRLVGISEPDVKNKAEGEICFKAATTEGRDTTITIHSDEEYAEYLSAVKKLIDVAGKANLRVIYTTRMFKEIPSMYYHIRKVMHHFKEDSTIFVYDFFNEPLYFDSLQRDKQDVYYITKEWQRLAREEAPYQLTTIGLANSREVFEWDPNLIELDFVTFHPYEFEPDQVMNEIAWYGRYVKKPWMIGETSLPSDNDSVPYAEQKKFTENTLTQTFNCNGIGYAWWQYKDVDWHIFHQSYMGVINRSGTSITSKGETVDGSAKPMHEVIKEFKIKSDKGPCNCLANYYNLSNFTQYKIIGKIVDDETNKPIYGACVQAWDEPWVFSYITSTKPDGTFALYGKFQYAHWMASATLYTMVRADCDLKKIFTAPDGAVTIDLGTLKLKQLKKHDTFSL